MRTTLIPETLAQATPAPLTLARLRRAPAALFLASLLLAAAAPLAQEPAPAAPSPQSEVPAAVEKWIQQLGSDRYRERLEAENELRQLGAAARPALEAAAKSPADSEVQWRAKRLLRQIGERQGGEREGGWRPGRAAPEAPRGLVERRSGRGRAPADDREPELVERRWERRDLRDVRAEFDRIFKRFEEMGLDVPSRRFFDEPFFKDLESQVGPGGRGGAGRSTSVQVGPDGVRVEVVEKGEDGKPETKVYEAPDMETFKKKHPGVLKGDGFSIGLDGFGGAPDALRSRIGELERAFEWDMARPRALRPLRGSASDRAPAAPPAGRRLGVTTKPIPDALRDYLELGDAGLMVGDVQEDTLAAACGLRSDDIVVAIGDVKIRGVEDVARALGAIGEGGEVRVDYIRRGRAAQAKATKRHDAARARQELPRKAERRTREKLR
jgi:hypothetical protein